MSIIKTGSPIDFRCSLTPVQCKQSRSSEGDKKFIHEKTTSTTTSDFQTKLFGSPSSEVAQSSVITDNAADNGTEEVLSMVEASTTQQDISSDETNEERNKREQRESEILAWEMLRQESIELYQMQVDFMRENAGAMSEADMNALQMAINESGRPDMYYSSQINNANNLTQDNDDDADDASDDGNDQSTESSEADIDEIEDPDNWDYERLLALGQVLGGRK